MDVPSAGEQEPGAGAPRENIDLSLDDIIKRNQKGQKQLKNRNRWRQPLKNRSPAPGNRRPRFPSWVPPALPGSSRFPRGFRKPQWTQKPFWSGTSGPGPRAAGQMQGRSPLNRAAFAQQDEAGKAAPGRNCDAAPAGPPPEAPARAEAFKAAGPPLPFRRPFQLNRRPAFLHSQSRFSFNKRQIKSKMEGKLLRMRRWQSQPSSGAVLTVSVSNPQARHSKGPGPRRPFPRRRNSQTPQPHRQPRGVPLRFNFRAMANQTSVTLNERFSGLRHKCHFVAGHVTSRMVTLP
ncbi:UAP56-interacting factor-like [Candoia aspera]|uniref:UAP56-interacting factor-like n=1 Tax=Candoia aspera TaxID=51853 RepID=UPI002FD83D1E